MAGMKFWRRLRSESGAELIETALTLPMILLVVVGIIEFGFVFQKYEVITNAAREAARVIILPAFSPSVAQTQANAEARVTQYLTAAGLNPALATVSSPTAWAADSEDLGGTCIWTQTVTVAYPHSAPFLAGIGNFFNKSLGTYTLHASSTMRTEVAAGACP